MLVLFKFSLSGLLELLILLVNYMEFEMRSFILIVLIALSSTGCATASKVDPELDNIAHLI